MKSFTPRHFDKLLDDLPEEVRRLARKQYALFEENPHHPGLNFKQVRDSPPIFSVRFGIHHRALARRVDNDPGLVLDRPT